MPTMGEKSLPLPGSSRRPRTYFPLNSSSSSASASSSSAGSWIAHLRSRTRLTNLAVVLILALTLSSVLLNASYYLDPGPPSTRIRTATALAASIEETIDRDPRIRNLRHLIMIPGHAIWTGHDPLRVEEDGEWVLEPMQRGGRSVRTFLRHIRVGVEMMKEDEGSLLVFSGYVLSLVTSVLVVENPGCHRADDPVGLQRSNPPPAISTNIRSPIVPLPSSRFGPNHPGPSAHLSERIFTARHARHDRGIRSGQL